MALATRSSVRSAPCRVLPSRAVARRMPLRPLKSLENATHPSLDLVDDGVVALTPETYKPFTQTGWSLVDHYTQWCGPCKMIAPEVVKMAAEEDFKSVRFAKFDCAQSKAFAIELGIKALPTFTLYKDGAKVDTFVGAKKELLRAFLVKHTQAAQVAA